MVEVKAAIPLAIKYLEDKGRGNLKVNYKLRDANFSRQRYWGEPFPIAYDQEGIAHQSIEKVWSFREESDIPLSFTLDAGANLHLLYPKAYKQKVLDFIEGELIVYCEKEHYICDEVGSGAKILKANYA